MLGTRAKEGEKVEWSHPPLERLTRLTRFLLGCALLNLRSYSGALHSSVAAILACLRARLLSSIFNISNNSATLVADLLVSRSISSAYRLA
jgi:hypothetical protein